MTNSQQSSRTKEVELPSGKYLLITVPEDVDENMKPELVGMRLQNLQWWRKPVLANPFFIGLPPGQWQIIGKANELSEQQWKAVVDYQLHPFSTKVYGYTYKNQESYSPFKKAKLAGHSLIKSHSMNPDTTLILKRQQ